MSAGLIGALLGALIAAIDFAVLNMLARRVDLDETKRALRITGLVQFLLLPAVGWFAAPYVIGE
ncbi:MAG: hypothetical protein K8H74_09735 [Notoacmeibacter sp.]|nr:hypothetical protein [Notoacmeibacter sp.]